MARLRYNGLTATLGGALTAADTTITFTAALTSASGAVPTITGSDTIALSILDTAGAVSEIVSLTAYTSGATTGTIARGQESTTATTHAAGDQVVHSPTAADFASSGSSGGGGLLGSADATTATTYTQSSNTIADIDATNLAVTFTAPASGIVEVECAGLVQSSASSAIWEWALRSGTTTVATLTIGQIIYERMAQRFRVTGLTPGASYTYKWAWYRLGTTAGTLSLFTGGNSGTNGNARMVVRSM